MSFARIAAVASAIVLAAWPLTSLADLYIDAKSSGLEMHSKSTPYCHIDGKKSAHCEDRLGQFPGQLNLSFNGHRAGCVVGGIRQYEYKPFKRRWDATVYKDYSKECHGEWQNDNTLWVYGTEK